MIVHATIKVLVGKISKINKHAIGLGLILYEWEIMGKFFGPSVLCSNLNLVSLILWF